MRLASEKYDLNDIENNFKQLTNFCVNEQNQNAKDLEILKMIDNRQLPAYEKIKFIVKDINNIFKAKIHNPDIHKN